MSKLIKLTLLALLGFVFNASAQQKAVEKAVISIPEAKCDSCKTRIELYVARQYGVSSIVVNIKKRNATVVWLTDRTDIEQIKTHIANCGFDADDVTADEKAYKRLSRCCQKTPAAVTPPVKQ